MQDRQDNYENRYLEQIKSQGFVRKLKYDAKAKNCAASRRLYTRLRKSFKNKDKTRRIKRRENILFYDSMKFGAILTGKNLSRNDCGIANPALDINSVDISKPCAGDSKALFKYLVRNGAVDREDTRERVATWLMENLQNDQSQQNNIIIDGDLNAALDTYSDICPPSYSFKDTLKPCNKPDLGVFHVDIQQTIDFDEERAAGMADEDFRYGRNELNHTIHQCIWCPCVFFFSVLCCIPAILLMTKADKYFLKNDMKEADWHTKMSTTLYICGFVATILFYIAVALFVVAFV